MTLQFGRLPDSNVLSSIARGRDPSLPRQIAIRSLVSSAAPDAAKTLGAILRDRQEQTRLRCLAAHALWRTNTQEAREQLLAAAQPDESPDVLRRVVKVLGRVGDAPARDAILAIGATASGVLAGQAEFAAAVISYRLGLAGHELPRPAEVFGVPDAQRQRFESSKPAPTEVDAFSRSMLEEPYGFDIAPLSLLQLSCPAGKWMVGLNQAVIGQAVDLLRARKLALGVLAAKNTTSGRYSVSHLFLCSPTRHEVRIVVVRVTGRMAWEGVTTEITGDRASFRIRTAARLGVFPIDVAGTINSAGNIEVTTAAAGRRVLEKRQPKPL